MTARIILPSGGGGPTPTQPWLNNHVVSSDGTITAGTTLVIPRYVEIAAGVTLEIEADGDLEIS